jgi:solute carrier family 35 (GDP-fucose transporter), member C1
MLDSDDYGVCVSTVTLEIAARSCFSCRNKWVLTSTEVPIFFLFSQMVVAVILFLACNAANVIKVPLELPTAVIRGLAPAVGLSVVGLMCVSARHLPTLTLF